MTEVPLPSGGGAYERQSDGSLTQVEPPTAPQPLAETPVEGLAAPAEEVNPIDLGRAVQIPVEGVVERPAKSKLKEA
jgi:hypothetical protein